MQTGNTVYAPTHAKFLNEILGTNYDSYWKCTYDLHNGYIIWLIRLNGKQSKDGWTNSLIDTGNTIQEFYTGDPDSRIPPHKILPRDKRIVFDIIENGTKDRKYVFRGIFVFDICSGNDNRIWHKIADDYAL